MEYKLLVALLLVSSLAYAADYGQCVYQDNVYQCTDVVDCAQSGGAAYSGLCPGPDNIKCCVTAAPTTTPGACTNVDPRFRQGYADYRQLIENAVASSGLGNYVSNPEALVASVISHESGWNPTAVGNQGNSIGLMQINVPAHPECDGAKIRAFDVEENVRCGVNFLAEITSTRNVNTPKAYSCLGVQYSGKDAILRWYNGWACGGDNNYVEHVNSYYNNWVDCLPGGETVSEDIFAPSVSGYGACDAPWSSYTCSRLGSNGACPQGGYTPLEGMCPTFANNIQCCIKNEALQSAGPNPYGNCQGIFSEYQCERVRRQGTSYTCVQDGYEPVAGFCPGASFVECCVPSEVRQQRLDSGDYTKCQAPLNKYDCTTLDACSASGGISYGSDFCTQNTVCCVPKDAHVEKLYVYDNANVIDDAAERQINDILETLDNEQKFTIDGQVKMSVVLQTELDNPNVNDDFVRRRYKELMLDKVYPSAIIVLKITTNTQQTALTPEQCDARNGFCTASCGDLFSLGQCSDGQICCDVGSQLQEIDLSNGQVTDQCVCSGGECHYLSSGNPCIPITAAVTGSIFEPGQSYTHEIKRYSPSRTLTAALYTLIFQTPGTTSLFDNGQYSEAFVKLSQDIAKYDQAYSKIKNAADEFGADGSCDSFSKVSQAVAESFDVPDSLKAEIAMEAAANADEACSRAWKDGVINELQDEIGDLNKAIEFSKIESVFDTTDPSCVQSQEGKYGCVAYPDGTFDIRECVNKKAYADSTVVSINAGDSCYTPDIGADDYFDLSNGQVRCAKDGSGFSLVQCTGTWHKGNSLAYDTQDSCASACSNTQGISQYCTEPRVESHATDTNGNIIRDGQIIQWVYVKLVSNNLNQKSSQDNMDRNIYHAIKYRIWRNGVLVDDNSVDCSNKNYCEVWISQGQTGPGWEIQYWSELSFQETNEKVTYVRSPATGVHSFKIAGQATDSSGTTPINQEVFFEWKSVSEKFTDLDVCVQTCKNTYESYADCLDPSQGLPLDAGTTNIIKDLRGSITRAQLEREKNFIANVISCYLISQNNVDPLAACVNDAGKPVSTASEFAGALQGNDVIDYSYEAGVNARLLMLRNIEKKFDDYKRDPKKAACYAAMEAAQLVESATSEAQKIINAYSLVKERCSGIDDSTARTNAQIAGDRIKNTHSPFSTGVMNVVESFGEPTNLKILGATVAFSVASTFIPATSVATASRISSGVKVITASAEAYFAVEMASGLYHSIGLCYEAGYSSAECGEATTQAVLFYVLAKSSVKNARASWELATGPARISALNDVRLQLRDQIKRNDDLISIKETSIEAREARLREQGVYDAGSELRDIQAQRNALAELKRKNEEARRTLDSTDGRAIALLDKLIEHGDITKRTGKSRAQIMEEELGKIVGEKKKSGAAIRCVTGLVTGFATCSRPDGTYAEEVNRRLDDILRPDGETAKIASGDPVLNLPRSQLGNGATITDIFNSDTPSITKAFDDIINNDQIQVLRGASYIEQVRRTKDFVAPEMDRIRLQSNDPSLDFSQQSTIAVAEIEILIERVRGEAPKSVLDRLENLKEKIVEENTVRNELGEAQAAFNEPIASRPRLETDISTAADRITYNAKLPSQEQLTQQLYRSDPKSGIAYAEVDFAALNDLFSNPVYASRIKTVLRKLDIPENAEMSVSLLGKGDYRRAYVVESAGKEFVIKIGETFEGEIIIQEYLSSQGIMPEYLAEGIRGNDYSVIFEEFVSGKTLAESRSNNIYSNFDVAQALGKLVARWWKSTESSGSAIPVLDGHGKNVVLITDSSGISAKYIDIHPETRVLGDRASFAELIEDQAGVHANARGLRQPGSLGFATFELDGNLYTFIKSMENELGGSAATKELVTGARDYFAGRKTQLEQVNGAYARMYERHIVEMDNYLNENP